MINKSIDTSFPKYLVKLIQKNFNFASLAIYYFHTHTLVSILYQH